MFIIRAGENIDVDGVKFSVISLLSNRDFTIKNMERGALPLH